MLTWRAVRPKRQAQWKTPNRHTEYHHIVMRLSLPAGDAHVVAWHLSLAESRQRPNWAKIPAKHRKTRH